MVFSPPCTSPGSVSRSKKSPDDMHSLADEMLRTSLTRRAASPALTSSSPPSFPRSAVPSAPPLFNSPSLGDLLSRERKSDAGWQPRLGSASITRDSKSSSVSSSSYTLYTSISAADSKARVHNLLREGERVKAEESERGKGELFRKKCSSDLLFLMDTTASMHSYINAAKEQVKSIVNDITEAFFNEAEVRVAVVSYKDHGDHPNIEFLDFTPSTNLVFDFLSRLNATGGKDPPEDVLGGVHRALSASWKHPTRCIIHIADAPPHGHGVLHDLGVGADDYPRPGSEPHGLTHGPLLKQLIQLKVNYALLRIKNCTDRMGLVFAQTYAECGANVKLLSSNRYSSQVNGKYPKDRIGLRSRASKPRANLQFEEMALGTTYSKLRHLVVGSVTDSITRSAGSETLAVGPVSKSTTAGITRLSPATDLATIREDEGDRGSAKGVSLEEDPATDPTTIREDEASSGSTGDLYLEEGTPQWDTPGWLNKTLSVEGFCPDLVVQSANSLNEMMSADENIKLSVAQLIIHARSTPFAEGSVRVASYARTSASTSKFVVKSFKKGSKMLTYLAEDMRIQALCKAFALEFNGLLNIEPPIDFIVTTCLQSKSEIGSVGDCFSLEPYIEGEYVKYNSNSMFVLEDSPDHPNPFNEIAQAFSHFTFERSWGHFLVNDLQGVGHLLTDPAIQTRDPQRFRLTETNLNEAGFKFFFVSHECNSICHKLELKSNRAMFISGVFDFREFWPTIEPTVCCSNKLCRRIVRLASTHESETFPGHHWCDACWAQLQASMVSWICVGPGPNHEFPMSKFFYESQGKFPPRKCLDHQERDRSVSRSAVLGEKIWNGIKTVTPKKSISGRIW